MEKKTILENMLDMVLSEKQMETIKEGWNAFYNDPVTYKNSIVIDMVKMSLKEEGANNDN